MAQSMRKLVAQLQSRFGLPAEAADHLAPLLERCVRLPEEEREAVLEALAAAFRAGASADLELAEQLRVLVGDLASELRKIDESLKVIGVHLERVRRRLRLGEATRTLH